MEASHCRGNSTVCTRNVVSKMNPMQFNLIGNKILTTTGTEEKGKKDGPDQPRAGTYFVGPGPGMSLVWTANWLYSRVMISVDDSAGWMPVQRTKRDNADR